MSEVPPTNKHCSVCGTQFECGAQRDSCWCQDLPSLAAAKIVSALDCRCPACLADALRAPTHVQLNLEDR